MKAFVDNLGRTWSLAINVTALRKIRAVLKIDLYKMLEKEPQKFDETLSDPMALVDLLFVLCQDQALAQSISDEDFGAALFGDAIEKAVEALVQELIDFFPNARVRAGLKMMRAKIASIRDQALTQMESELELLTPEIILGNLTARQSKLSGSSPGS